MRNEEQRELLAKLSCNTDLQLKDCQPLRLSEKSIPKPVPPAQRTVFPEDTDWASSATRTVLDAFKESYTAQVEESGINRTLLPLLRSSGAVEVDSSMADLFDDDLLGSTNAVKGAGERLVQCNKCHRPVLITRILGHVRRCSGQRKEDEDDETDTEMQLICPPFEQNNSSTPPKTPPPSSNHPNANSAGKRESDDVAKSVVKDEDDWRTRLTPVVPRYVPRGASSKKRQYALPPPTESPSQRKKNINVERKALAAAAAAGIVSSNPPNPADASPASKDPLWKLAQKWGPAAPWSKIMQVALPLVVPRNSRKRTSSAKELQAANNGKGIVNLNGSVPNSNGSSKSGTKPVETYDKQSALTQQGPTVLGSLLWLRGQGMKELSNTPLQSMDVPQMPISRSGPIFHGHTYIAPLGTFETDPRHHNTIKMPATSVNPAAPANTAQNRANQASRNGSSDSRAKQTSSQPTMSATNSGSSQAPPTKKQRTAKQQRSQTATPNGQHINTAAQLRAGAVPNRKMSNMRLPPGVSAGSRPVTTQEAVQRLQQQQRNMQQGPKGVHALNQGVPGVSNAAAAKYAATQALQQKQMLRQGVVAGMPVNRLPPGAVAGSAQNAAGPGLPTTAKAGTGRVVKGRPHTVVGSASPSMRSSASVAVKSQSPGQRSSRSTDRTPMGTPARVPQYDPTILATAAAAQAAAKGSRAAAMRPTTGNPQFDFQQVVAQIAAQSRANRDDFDPTRGLVPNIAAHQRDAVAARLQQAQAMQGMSPHQRLKHQTAVQNAAAQRNAAALKNRQALRIRKEAGLKKTPSIGQQLQNAEAMQAKAVAGKVNALSGTVPYVKPADAAAMNAPASHGFYSAALVAGQQGAAGAAMKGQPNIHLLRMAHANQNRLVPGQTDANANFLQNMHDVHQMQNMPVVLGMRGAAQNQNVMSMLQANALSAGFPNAGLNAAAQGLQGNLGLTGQNPNILANEALMQQLLASRNSQINQNATLQAQQLARAGQLAAAKQLPRTAGIPRPVVPTAQNSAVLEELELDRALGIDGDDFDEKDLIN